MTSNQILGMILPTCYPDRAFEKLFSDDSLKWMEPLKSISTFLINFQPSWTNDLISKLLTKLDERGFSYKYTYNKYEIPEKGHIPMNRIRNDCADLLDCAMYVLIDDDFVFDGPYGRIKKNAGQQYVDAVHYMSTHDKCGIISMRFKPLSKPKDLPVPDNCIYPNPLESMYRTGYGLFTRSLKDISTTGKFMPTDSLDLVGGGEEKVLAGHVLSYGLYPARMSRCLVLNKVGGDSTGWDSKSIMESNNDKYIKDHFNPNYSGHHHYDIIDPAIYESRGGIPFSESLYESLGYDYTDSDTNELINEIINIWEDK